MDTLSDQDLHQTSTTWLLSKCQLIGISVLRLGLIRLAKHPESEEDPPNFGSLLFVARVLRASGPPHAGGRLGPGGLGGGAPIACASGHCSRLRLALRIEQAAQQLVLGGYVGKILTSSNMFYIC